MLKCGQMKCGYSRLWRLFKQPNTVGISQEIYNLRYIYSHSRTLSLSRFLLRTVHPTNFRIFHFPYLYAAVVAFTLFNNSLWNFRQRFKSSVLSLNFRFFVHIDYDENLEYFAWFNVFLCNFTMLKIRSNQCFPHFSSVSSCKYQRLFLPMLHYRKDITSIRIHFIHFLFHLSRFFLCRVSNSIWIEPCQFSNEQNKMLTFNKNLKFEFR